MRPYIVYEKTSFDWLDGVDTAAPSVTTMTTITPATGRAPRAHPNAITAIHAASAPSRSAARSTGVSDETKNNSTAIVIALSASDAYTTAVPTWERASSLHRSRTATGIAGMLGGDQAETAVAAAS